MNELLKHHLFRDKKEENDSYLNLGDKLETSMYTAYVE